ncbi:MAG: hypothetical protein ACTSR8_11590 [Promethearchaeota archaeon]
MINLEVKLPDRPGSLIELIEPISKNGGNIYGILHHHDKKNNNMIPVSISFELSNEILDVSLNNIKKELVTKNIQIISVNIGEEKQEIVIILTGHVFETGIADTIKTLVNKGIGVIEVQGKITSIKDVSNVKFKLIKPDSVSMDKLYEVVNKICEKKNLTLIRT